MKMAHRIRILFGFVFALLLAASVGLADEAQYFECTTVPDSMGNWVEDPSTHRYAIAVYAAKRPGDSTLPSWWQTIWGSLNYPGINSFFQDNSLNRYSVSAHPYGFNNNYCYTSSNDPILGAYPNPDFISDIFSRLDADVNLQGFDENPIDGIADAVFIFVPNDTNTVPDGYYFGAGTLYTSPTDKNIYNQNIRIEGSRTVWVRAHGVEAATTVGAHHWGHALGLPDLWGGTDYQGLGGFSIMGKGFPCLRAVPLDPWSRQKLGWDSTIEVTNPLYGESIPDYITTGVIYKLPKDTNEYFLVTNHRGINPPFGFFWEQEFEGFGPLIWHVDRTGDSTWLDFEHKVVDLELAHGLFTSGGCTFTTTPNPASGRDSLDVYPGCGFPDTALQSGSCFYNAVTQKKIFDGLSNPNSDGYVDSVDTYHRTRVQLVPTHLAVRNIQTANGPGYSATADILVNNWYGHITANTTWGPNKVFAITGDITVDAGKTLTIDSNTVIYLQAGEDNQKAGVDTTKIEIYVASGGKLIVNGTPNHPVKFLSSKAEAQAGKDDWQGIKVEQGGFVSISNAVIRHAVTGIEDNSEYSHSIQNVRIGKCKSYGIRAQDTDSLIIRGCRVDSVNNYPSAGGTGIYANSSSYIGAKLVKDTAIACYYGFSIGHNSAPVDTCIVLGDSTGGLVSNVGIFNQLQGQYGDTAYTLPISNTVVGGYFSLAHISNGSTGRLNISTCQVYTNEGTPRSPVGIQNDGGDFLKVRNSSIWHWGLYGVLTDHSGGVPNLGVYSGDNGYNDLYTGVSGSGWKFVYDEDCGSCSTPVIKAEYNQWYTTPSSSRFSPNVDRTPYITPIPWEKLVADEGRQKENLPNRTELFQNYPNPFNPTTLIQFNLEKPERVNLEIFNILGQKVRTMVPGEEFAAGPYTFLWDGKDDKGRGLSSGMYFYRLLTPGYSKTHKMMLVK